MYSQLRMYFFSGVCTKLLFFTCMKKTLFVLCIWRHRYLKGPYATQPSPRTKLCVACQQQNMKRQGLNPSSLFIPFSSSVPQLGEISIPREAKFLLSFDFGFLCMHGFSSHLSGSCISPLYVAIFTFLVSFFRHRRSCVVILS